MQRCRVSIGLLFTLALSLPVGKVNAGTAAVSFTGTLLLSPSCKVTSAESGRIEVNFGDNVGIMGIDGVHYRQPLSYRITCNNAKPAGTGLVLTLKGDIAAFDATQAALQTSVEGLAIRILQNGSPMVINQPLKVTQDALPTLEAVPVKQPGVPLQEGPFEAIATLLADYQ